MSNPTPTSWFGTRTGRWALGCLGLVAVAAHADERTASAFVDPREAGRAIAAFEPQRVRSCVASDLGASPSGRAACRARMARARPVATGRFFGADPEVLLAAPTYQSRADGDVALALMRKVRGRYVFVGNILQVNGGFASVHRVEVGRGRHALFLCTSGGSQGRYGGECGVLGERSLRADFEIRSSTECGRRTQVEVRSVEHDHTALTLTAHVVVRSVVLRAESDDDPTFCNVEASAEPDARYDVRYSVRQGRLELDAPVPSALRDATD